MIGHMLIERKVRPIHDTASVLDDTFHLFILLVG
jgi:hypothetical protein